MAMESILWQRVDTPGHDACIINRNATGWKLSGNAVFLHDGDPAMLSYKVVCDADWRTLYGQAEGWLGKRQATPLRTLPFFVIQDLVRYPCSFNSWPIFLAEPS